MTSQNTCSAKFFPPAAKMLMCECKSYKCQLWSERTDNTEGIDFGSKLPCLHFPLVPPRWKDTTKFLKDLAIPTPEAQP